MEFSHSQPTEEIILSSSSVAHSEIKSTAVEFILGKVEENLQCGRMDWVTDSVTAETVTLAEVEPFSRRVASALLKRGMLPGDVVIYMTSNVTRIYTIILGVWRIGGIIYSSFPDSSLDDLVQVIQESEARWIFCDPKSVPQVTEAMAQLQCRMEIFVFGNAKAATSVDNLLLDDGKNCPITVPNPGLDDPILIVRTSGTTGRSKGVVHTNKSILSCLISTPATRKPIMFLTISTNMTGIIHPMRCACAGTSLIMMNERTRENILYGINKYKPSAVIGFNRFVKELISGTSLNEYDLSSVESIGTTGERLNETLYNSMFALPNVKKVVSSYGLTECPNITIQTPQSNYDNILKNIPKRSVGRLNANTQLKVVDLDTGLTLGPNKQGELVVRSPRMATGYWKLPEISALAFIDGWVKTGDLGYYDKEGYIYFVNRIDEIFKYDGIPIYPSQLEAKILKHPAVSEVVVVGVSDPNGKGKIPMALVVLQPGETATSAEIREHAEQKLAHNQKLRGGLFIIHALQRGKTGKILKSVAANV